MERELYICEYTQSHLQNIERIMANQLMSYFDNLLSTHLSAYRRWHSCQHAILQLTEYWRKALDEGQNVGTVAMDLSKAFDKMPHALLIAKLHAYNVSSAACNLIIWKTDCNGFNSLVIEADWRL